MNFNLRCLTMEASIGFVTIYNSIISIIDFFILIITFILLTDGNHNFGDIAAIIMLVFAIMVLPCIICGICYTWSLFHIQNNLRMARFFGVCNLVMMIITFILITTHLEAEKEIENPGIMAFFMILNTLSIVSVIYLCTINCGFEEEEPVSFNDRVFPDSVIKDVLSYINGRNSQPITLNDVVYPVPIIEDKVELQIIESDWESDCENIEHPSAPQLSPSMEGRPTLR